MASIYPAKPTLSFEDIKAQLLAYPTPLLPPNSVHDPALTDAISSLYLHPTLETLLHILNQDLPSAHFLVRHMQAAPKYEGMYLHGILHRVEGDIDNARAWYADVCGTEVFERVWGVGTEEEKREAERDKESRKVPTQRRARAFLDGLEDVQRGINERKEEVKRDAKREIEMVLEWCVEKFGTGRRLDVSDVWVQPGQDSEHARLKEKMLTGGEGFRKF